MALGLSDLEGLKIPKIRKDGTHVYYIFALIYDDSITGVPKEKIIEALTAEGVPGLKMKYVNLHLLPMYQKKIAYGSKGFPWTISNREISYDKGICPVAENLNDSSFIGIEMCRYDYSFDEIDRIIESFRKVWKNLNQLK